MRGPEFLCVGVQRSGSTWLYKALRSAPGVWLPPINELHYFDSRPAGGEAMSRRYRQHARARLKSYLLELMPAGKKHGVISRSAVPELNLDDVLWDLNYFTGSTSVDWYLSLFDAARNRGLIAGELTPKYSALDCDRVGEIAKLLPDCKIIMVLRNPIERAWSQMSKTLLRDRNRALSEVAPDELYRFFEQDSVTARGRYSDIVARWRKYYGDNVYLGFYDELVSEPVYFIKGIIKFIGSSLSDEHLSSLDLTALSSASGKVAGKMPTEFYEFLATQYKDDIRQLSGMVDYPVSRWIS